MKTVFAAALLLLVSVTSAGAAPPRIETVDCTQFVEVAEGLRVECGMLHVPENRANPRSRTIGVPFMRVFSTAAASAREPLIMMMGGPGSRTIPRRFTGRETVYPEGDVIWLEQRGARNARPALDCPEYAAAHRQIRLGLIGPDDLARQQIEAARLCAQRARRAGADLSGYTSVQIAADIEDLRRLLGYERVNLYAISYSGVVMSVYAREYPAQVRAIVFNTPLPVEGNYDEYGSAGVRRTLNQMFDACAVDRHCAASYPDVRHAFNELIENAQREPFDVALEDGTNVRVTGWVMSNALADQLYGQSDLQRLPSRINAIANGDRDALREILSADGSDYPWLMRIAVWCNEEAPFEDSAAIARQRADYAEFAGVDQSTAPQGVCEASGLTARPAQRENEPVAIDAPVLIFSGAFDPATPPMWQIAMARRMPHAQHVVFPWAGHGAGFSSCGITVTHAFLIAPDTPVNATCVNDDPLDFEPGD